MTPRGVLLTLAIALALVSAALLERQWSLGDELATLATARAGAAEATDDALLATDVDRIRLALERARATPARTARPHLALAISDGVLTFERGDIVLRSTTASANVPRGVHRVERVEAVGIGLEGGIVLVPAADGDASDPPAGVVRLPPGDFAAIRPNVRPGLVAYFF